MNRLADLVATVLAKAWTLITAVVFAVLATFTLAAVLVLATWILLFCALGAGFVAVGKFMTEAPEEDS